MTAARVVIAADKFKGTLSAHDVAVHIDAGLRSVAPDLDIIKVPVADGGDGTLDAAISAGFEEVPLIASGPTGVQIETRYARRGTDAVIELAAVCGLSLLPDGVFDPLNASSTGLGEIIRAAVDAGCRRIILGVGGSASTDGGAGMLAALGVRILDRSGVDLPAGGGALGRVDRLDLAGLHPDVAGTEFVVACDVDNPLYGPRGAAHVYGPQKGATAADVSALDAALRRWASVVAAATGTDAADAPGSGAAGGVAYAARTVLGATLRSGIELVLDLVGFSGHLSGARLVITGEGTLDSQTLAGKAPAGVAAAARAAGVRTVAVAGRSLLTTAELAAAGISAVYPLTDIEPDPAVCLTQAGPLLEQVATNLARDWLTGTPG